LHFFFKWHIGTALSLASNFNHSTTGDEKVKILLQAGANKDAIDGVSLHHQKQVLEYYERQ
jgi:hypothetical protein